MVGSGYSVQRGGGPPRGLGHSGQRSESKGLCDVGRIVYAGKHVHLVERVCLLRHLPLMAVLWEPAVLGGPEVGG